MKISAGLSSEFPKGLIARLEGHAAARLKNMVFYVQPVWRFAGHYSTGDEFEILVQALDPRYLK